MNNSLFESVLFVGPDFRKPRGGIAQVLNTYSKEVCKPFNCIITTPSEGGYIIKMFVLFKALFLFVINCNKSKIKIVHIHTASNLSFWRKTLFLFIARLFHKKTVLHIHGGNFKEFVGEHHNRVVKVLRKSDCVVCLSSVWELYFKEELKIKYVVTIPNVINNPQKVAGHSVHSCTNEKLTLLFFGLICQNKGIFDLLDVLGKNVEIYTSKLRLMVGGNGEIVKFNQIVKDKKLQDVVEYKGWVTGVDKVRCFMETDYFILPSYVEGTPISILEAMSYSLPIISTNVGGIPEIVKDGYNGYLFTPGDKEKLESIINDVINNSENKNLFGEKSGKLVKPYLPDSVKRDLMMLYNSLLK